VIPLQKSIKYPLSHFHKNNRKAKSLAVILFFGGVDATKGEPLRTNFVFINDHIFYYKSILILISPINKNIKEIN